MPETRELNLKAVMNPELEEAIRSIGNQIMKWLDEETTGLSKEDNLCLMVAILKHYPEIVKEINWTPEKRAVYLRAVMDSEWVGTILRNIGDHFMQWVEAKSTGLSTEDDIRLTTLIKGTSWYDPNNEG